MKISIVVPAFNEEKLITSCLRSIREAAVAFDDLPVEVEVVVCDNNSTDRTAELARAEGAKVIFEPHNQIARARNTGAGAATGDWLIFVDADSHPTRELFADVLRAIQSGDCLAGGSTVRLDGRYPVAKLITEGWNLLSRVRKWAAGSFIFCERKAFQQVGGFNEELFASEEIDLSIRLNKLARRQGKRVVILHRHPLTTSARKLHLYSVREHLGFLAKTIMRFGSPLRSRDECFTWYDGRR
jgi:glycosyltransferase involved in cell wall biosynthesis